MNKVEDISLYKNDYSKVIIRNKTYAEKFKENLSENVLLIATVRIINKSYFKSLNNNKFQKILAVIFGIGLGFILR